MRWQNHALNSIETCFLFEKQVQSLHRGVIHANPPRSTQKFKSQIQVSLIAKCSLQSFQTFYLLR